MHSLYHGVGFAMEVNDVELIGYPTTVRETPSKQDGLVIINSGKREMEACWKCRTFNSWDDPLAWCILV